MSYRSLLLTSLGACVAVAFAADGLDVKTGLWEMTFVTDLRGSLMTNAQLEKLTPAQRAKVAATEREQAAKGPQTWTDKTCLTAQDLAQGAFRSGDDKDDPDCKYTITAQTRTLQEGKMACSGDTPRTSQMRIEAQGRERIKGFVVGGTERGKLSLQVSGRWLSASCAGADED